MPSYIGLNEVLPLTASEKVHLPFDRPFDKPFDKLTVLSKVEGLTVLSKVEGLMALSKAEGLRCASSPALLN